MKSICIASLPTFALLALVGCASSGPQAMHVNRSNPAAYGEVEAKEEVNGNTRIKLTAEHLARPQAVSPTSSTYVVWAQDPVAASEPQNLGALLVDENLKARFEAITPLKRFDIFVTPEPVTTAQYPTGEKALWTTVTE